MATKNDVSAVSGDKKYENKVKDEAEWTSFVHDGKNNNGPHPAYDYSQIQPHLRYRNAREYAQALQPWLHNYRRLSQMNAICSMMPMYNMSCMGGGNAAGNGWDSSIFRSTGTTNDSNASYNNTQPATPSNNVHSNNTSAPVNGVLYRVPTFWRRVAAELIDFTLLFYIKLLVTLFVMKRWGHMYDSIDYQELFTMEEMDYDKAFAITSEVIAMEIINRLLITIFETLCLRHGIGTVGGATPGKRLLGLKLISGEQIVDQGNGTVLVSPATDVGWLCAFVRSSIKNFTIAFFLPACLTLFFHSHNRTVYDVITKTIVVQNVEPEHR
ncbi:protein FAM8A1 isoform X1 [Patella vulgata]|uniref:protein FAM8A1 isoform X1 n=1 Tax=Patella vulgata TaxID=6465 RepID=UPI0021807F24|nr:protein FAM8A1 isoform X1 [Patella vulgata]